MIYDSLSLTGSDSSEVAEIQPIEAKIKCEWTDRFLERVKDGFRVWLRCKITRASITQGVSLQSQAKNVKVAARKHAEATLILSVIPQADRIIVVGIDGERVIEPGSNVINILISSLDQNIEIKKAGYKTSTIDLPKNLSHGSKIQKDIVLERK